MNGKMSFMQQLNKLADSDQEDYRRLSEKLPRKINITAGIILTSHGLH